MRRHRRSRSFGGYIFAENPDRSFDSARIIWTAAIDPSVLPVSAKASLDAAFDVNSFAHHCVRDTSGIEHIAIGLGSFLLRLDVVAGTVLDGPVELCVHLDCTRLVTRQLVSLDLLLRTIGIRDAGRRPRSFDPRLSHLVEGLTVIDALAQGASLADIAADLAHLPRPYPDWPGDGEHVKSRARRRVELARRLLKAGPAGVLNYRI